MSSTNDRAKVLAEAGAPDGTMVVADEQTAGRGRRGRAWNSPPGCGLWCSVLVRPRLAPARASRLLLWGALAVARTLEMYAPGAVGIKWPNDVLLCGRKVAGVLVETEARSGVLHYAVVGIGINVNQSAADFPPGLREKAISVRMAAGSTRGPIDRAELEKRLWHVLRDTYAEEEPQQFSGVVAAVQPYSVILGRRVRVVEEYCTWEGEAVALTCDGLLEVRDDSGRVRTVHAAEVSLAIPAGGVR